MAGCKDRSHIYQAEETEATERFIRSGKLEEALNRYIKLRHFMRLLLGQRE